MTYRTFAIAALALAGSVSVAAAQVVPQSAPPSAPANQTTHLSVAPAVAVNSASGKTLLSSTLVEIDPAFAGSQKIVKGYITLGKTTLNCPNTATQCVIEASQQAQVLGKVVAVNKFAICFNLDNARVTCPYVGLVPPNEWFSGTNSSWKSSITPGNHIAEFLIYTDLGGYVGRYGVTYRVYK
jgi:hypothetical protein